jgi:hypothetical protein
MSAMVLVRSASGARVTGGTAITAENVDRYRPAAGDVREARAAFTARGFQAGELVGIAFAITAPQATFERTFRVTLEARDDGAVSIAGRAGLELPLEALPEELGRLLVAVTFSPPADLHGGFFP